MRRRAKDATVFPYVKKDSPDAAPPPRRWHGAVRRRYRGVLRGINADTLPLTLRRKCSTMQRRWDVAVPPPHRGVAWGGYKFVLISVALPPLENGRRPFSRTSTFRCVARLLWERAQHESPRFYRSPEKPLFMRTFGTL